LAVVGQVLRVLVVRLLAAQTQSLAQLLRLVAVVVLAITKLVLLADRVVVVGALLLRRPAMELQTKVLLVRLEELVAVAVVVQVQMLLLLMAVQALPQVLLVHL
jgi:hypothetical protein